MTRLPVSTLFRATLRRPKPCSTRWSWRNPHHPPCRAASTLLQSQSAIGVAVNVVGTVNVFEAAKKFKLGPVSYASSMAVHGQPEDYPEMIIDQIRRASPRTHYGVFKQANEGTARTDRWDDGVASICLRPYIVYGVARDQGMTSSPTQAMLAVARVNRSPHSLWRHGWLSIRRRRGKALYPLRTHANQRCGGLPHSWFGGKDE